MTYKELAEKILHTFNQEQLAQDVVIWMDECEEFIPIHEIQFEKYQDVLDIGHPYLTY